MAMSIDRIQKAARPSDAGIDGGSPRTVPVGLDDLAALADAVRRVEKMVRAGRAALGDDSGAVERIADIAFVLHERNVESSLCDALDSAVREIGAAAVLRQADGQRAQQAAALLREISRVIDGIAARSGARIGASSAMVTRPASAADDSPEMDLPADGGCAEVEEALSALPPRPDADAAASGGRGTAAMGVQIAEARAPAADRRDPLPGAQDDPGDLFEPAGVPAAAESGEAGEPPALAGPNAAAAALMLSLMPDIKPAAAASPRAAAELGSAAPATPGDPLAALRALNEEELIALFT